MSVRLLLLAAVLPRFAVAQFSAADIAGMKRMLADAPAEGYVHKLHETYPGMITELGRLPVEAIDDPAILRALLHPTDSVQGPYPSVDSSCALVRLRARGQDEWARVCYIYLAKQSGTDLELQQRADSILLLIQQGWPFTDAASALSMDGNSMRGGDLGWFTPTMMVPEFSDPVFQHHRGDLFTASVGTYGWYVVLVTEEPKARQDVEYILGRGAICP